MAHPNGGSIPPPANYLYIYAGSGRPTVINNEPFFVVQVSQLGNNHYQIARFTVSPPSQNTIVSGPPSTHPPYGGAVGSYNGHIYYAGYPSPTTPDATRSLFQFNPVTSTITQAASLPSSYYGANGGLTFSKMAGSVLYLGYSSAASNEELYGYTSSAGLVQITSVDGNTAGFNPRDIVSYNGNLLIAGTTSINGAELYRITGTGLSLTDAQQASAAILSSNPASTQITIKLPSASRHTVHILSSTGQTLRAQTFQGASASVSVEDLAPGLYFARITDATTGAIIGTAHFVKE